MRARKARRKTTVRTFVACTLRVAPDYLSFDPTHHQTVVFEAKSSLLINLPRPAAHDTCGGAHTDTRGGGGAADEGGRDQRSRGPVTGNANTEREKWKSQPTEDLALWL